MSLSVAGRLYYVGCSLLWDVLAGFHYLFDDNATTEVDQGFTHWGVIQSDLCNWLMDEHSFPIDNEKQTRILDHNLYLSSETMGDKLLFGAANRLSPAAEKAHFVYPNIDKVMWLYFFYCRWLLRTLSEFDQILQTPDLRSTEYFQRYQKKYIDFEKLAAMLEKERPNIAPPGHNSNALKLEADIDSIAMQIAKAWRQTVYSASNDPNYEPNF